MKTLTIFGTRPEAIKMAPLVKKLEKSEINNKVVVTAQHREMLDQVLDIFEIKPDYDLDIMKKNQDIYDITSNVLIGLKKILKEEQPDAIFVHGDTTTTMAASMAAFYNKTSIYHVEAGLRTYNKYSPYPEEMNRKITGTLTDIHFAPTNSARDNLIDEKIMPENIFITGNTVIDALFYARDYIKNNNLDNLYSEELKKKCCDNIFEKRIILITGHRRENFGENFKNIFQTYRELSDLYKDKINFIYPVHLNPNVKDMAHEMLGNRENFFLIEPLDYLRFVFLMEKSFVVITDSGGIQEEAPSFGKPVLVTRDCTERPEAVEAGTVELVGSDPELIKKSFIDLIENNNDKYKKMSMAHNPYGDGIACEKIINSILNFKKMEK